MKKIIFLFCVLLANHVCAQFEPCSDGSQPMCTCSTAPLLCSSEDLNGFTFSMSSYSHPNDGPTGGMCFAGENTTSNNPTWFAFVAGCSALTLKVNFSGCNDLNPGASIWAGIQAAVYGDCNNYLGSVVGCSTSGQCDATSGSRTIEMTDLLPGKTYYFLTDGCFGSACTNVMIEVLTPPCPPSIQQWNLPLQGPDVLLQYQSAQFLIETVLGGTEYVWTINSIVQPPSDIIQNDSTFSINREFTFNTIGTNYICVDVLNDCIPIVSSPLPNCKTITVLINDIDEDGIADEFDNCINVFNPDQFDTDGDLVGNLCDNCPSIPNSNQLDCNNNGIGDLCELLLDTDCDGVFDTEDNCPGIFNPFQIDQNNNNIGDACEEFPKVGINTQEPKSELHLSNGSLYIDNPEKGIILKDYQGNCFILKVINSLLALETITCPN